MSPARANTAPVQRQEQKRDIPEERALTISEVRTELDQIRGQLEEVLPSRMDPDRFLRVVAGALLKSPQILRCDRVSIFRAVLEAAQLGLEPTGLLGSAYIVPYRVQGKLQAQLIPGYRGLIDLARRSGEIEGISAHVVRAKDYFRIRQGTDPGIEHEPYIAPPGAKSDDPDPEIAAAADPGPYVGAYMIAILRDRSGQPSIRQTEWMSIAEIEAVRKRSRAADGGPWVTDYSEMCRKTVVRRGAKYLPLTPDAVRGFSLDEMAERDADVPARAGVKSKLVRTLADRRGVAVEEGSDDVAPDGDDGPPLESATDGSTAVEAAPSGVCGATSDPELGPVESCNLAPGHEGPHISKTFTRFPNRAVPETPEAPQG